MRKEYFAADLEQVFLKERSDSGLFITITGFDGSGKTTQIEAMANEFRKRNKDVLVTAQPNDWFRNQPINRHYLEHGGTEIQARILALMAAAARLVHVHDVILPALNEGKVVICDRYVHAAFAVFLHRGIDSKFLADINEGLPRPDYSFYLSVPPETLIQRLNHRDKGNLKYEERKIERITSIIHTYEQMGSQLIKIDGIQEADQVTNSIMKHIKF
ncbi:dTMP kinase [Paenibacillus kobensis]|uniref:dTMP kinase n=1 Tax=Paenibacillus kobensis TaxID=59841 RepID=UPI0013E2CAF1|nr:dTMP kinase [Paenibacillus kobensis]